MRKQVAPNGGTVKVYANTPLGLGFQTILDETNLYTGPYGTPKQLIEDLKRNDLFEDDPGAYIDTVYFGTCEVDMEKYHDELLQAWESRPANDKFLVICGVHNARTVGWQKLIPEWSRRRSFRILSISDHVSNYFRKSLSERSDSPDPNEYSALMEYVKIDQYYIIAPIQDPIRKPANSGLVTALIQGNYEPYRRDYANFYRDLIASMKEDPKAWGYRPLSSGKGAAFEKDEQSPIPAFQLHLAGGHGDFQVPDELANVVKTHKGLDYKEFFALAQEMDIMVPAFSKDGAYYEAQGSSTPPLALECNVPLLATRRVTASYPFIDDERAVVIRPQGVREVAALKALRTGSTEHLKKVMQASPEMAWDIEQMMKRGWKRTNEEFSAVKRKAYENNERVVARILRDM
ncbi:hypothetical protein FRC03_002300 [Tulasnella sp. 419]|nr:hypothetical protein FRC03_002300 [Tulasnella sp. 419]